MDIAVVANVEQHVSVKTEDDLPAHGPTCLIKSKSSKKAMNKDLPEGAHPIYHHDVVPSIWHWVAGHAPDPFNINECKMVKALSNIWRRVYAGSIEFNIPPVVSLVSVTIMSERALTQWL
jgi:hypothetical protein